MLYLGQLTMEEYQERKNFLLGKVTAGSIPPPLGAPIFVRPGVEGYYEAMGTLGEPVELGHMTLDDTSTIKPIIVSDDE